MDVELPHTIGMKCVAQNNCYFFRVWSVRQYVRDRANTVEVGLQLGELHPLPPTQPPEVGTRGIIQ